MKNKKRIIRAILVALMLSTFMLSGCSNNSNTQETESETTQSTTMEELQSTTAEEQTQEEQTQEETQIEEITEENEETLPQIDEGYNEEIPDITGEWEALDGESVSSGVQMSLVEIYGTSAKYGGTLKLNSDGTMFVSVGVDTGKDNEGTYTVDNSGIHIVYESGAEETFYYYDDLREMPVIKAKLGDYYIYFIQAQ